LRHRVTAPVRANALHTNLLGYEPPIICTPQELKEI
jgi:hypothetical protein